MDLKWSPPNIHDMYTPCFVFLILHQWSPVEEKGGGNWWRGEEILVRSKRLLTDPLITPSSNLKVLIQKSSQHKYEVVVIQTGKLQPVQVFVWCEKPVLLALVRGLTWQIPASYPVFRTKWLSWVIFWDQLSTFFIYKFLVNFWTQVTAWGFSSWWYLRPRARGWRGKSPAVAR